MRRMARMGSLVFALKRASTEALKRDQNSSDEVGPCDDPGASIPRDRFEGARRDRYGLAASTDGDPSRRRGGLCASDGWG